MLKLLVRKGREALAQTNFKENLRKRITQRKKDSIKKAHAFVTRNLDILLETTL